MKQISIICPAYNEAAGILQFLRSVDDAVRPLSDAYRFRLVLIDDGSADCTPEIAADHQGKSFELVVCCLSRNFGKEAALQAGLDLYPDEANILMDADLQHPPELLPAMVLAWDRGAKIVEAVKRSRGAEPRIYRVASRLFYRFMSSAARLDLNNRSDYLLLDASVSRILRLLPERQRFLRGLLQWTGIPRVEIMFDVPPRHAGDSSWSALRLIQYSLSNIAAFSSLPLQLVSVVGAVMLLLSLMLGGITLVRWFEGTAVTGFTTVILLLLIVGSMLMISLGVIGLYLAKIYDEVKQRPLYVLKHGEVRANRSGRTS